MDIFIPSSKFDIEDGEDYSNSQHERHPHGIIIANGREVGVTMQCPHCGAHFRSVKGSGHRRTFCLKHMAVTCGEEKCDPCVDLDKVLGR